MTNDSKTMFEKIRAFLTVYMPKQRGLSNCTIDSYRQVINQFLGFIMEKKGIPYDEISFREWNAQTEYSGEFSITSPAIGNHYSE